MTRPHLPLNPEQLQAVQFYVYMKGDGFYIEYEKELARIKMSAGLKKGIEAQAYEATEKLYALALGEDVRRFMDKEVFKSMLYTYHKNQKPKPTTRSVLTYQ